MGPVFCFNRNADGFHGVNICGFSTLGPPGGPHHRCAPPPLQRFCFTRRSGWGPRMSISDKFPADIDVTGPGTPEQQVSRAALADVGPLDTCASLNLKEQKRTTVNTSVS